MEKTLEPPDASSPGSDQLDGDILDELYEPVFFDNVEDHEEYKFGGFHPVHLNDELGNSNRYRVLHKLGNGGLATVWLCRDNEKDSYVALKIIMAKVSGDDSSELKLVQRKDINFDQPGGKHILLPLDYFWINGPNGSHLCLVYPVLGPRVPVIWHTRPDPHKIARNITRQVTEGLGFLHRNGIGHGG